MATQEQTAWANGPLDFDVASAMPRLEASMEVRLITTCPFAECGPEEAVATIKSNPVLREFDHIPVRERGQIIGVFNRREDHRGKECVREAMIPLNEWYLLSADAPLLTFVEKADERPFCLVLDGEAISGIVTLSDLQKLPVRPAIFLRVTHLEILLAEYIRKSTPRDQWLSHLHPKQAEKVRHDWKALHRRNLVIDLVSATKLAHKIEVALKMGAFPGRINAKSELREIRELRDSVAHAWDYAGFPDEAKKVPQRVRLVKEYIELLNACLASYQAQNAKGTEIQ